MLLMTDDTPPNGHLPAADDQPQATNEPGPVPYKRFAEVNRRARELETQLAAFQNQAKTAEEERLAGEAKWKELAEKREQELKAVQSQLQEASIAQLRLQVAATHGIPANLAGRLVGSTLEELTTDAQAMQGFLKPVTPGMPPLGNNRQPGPDAPTPEQMRDAKWVRENKQKVLAAQKR